jgi:hypothetical protein
LNKVLGDAVCLQCNGIFHLKKANQKYCSVVCRNQSSNARLNKSTDPCEDCNAQITKLSRTGRCSDCYSSFIRKNKISSWLDGKWRGGTDTKLSRTIRQYLLKEANYTCTRSGCGFNTPHPIDGESVLEVNHIDGNGANHKPSNLEVICPNHHALTESYRGRNVGNGRKTYYIRVRR